MTQKVITLIEIFDNQRLAEWGVLITNSLRNHFGSTNYEFKSL